MVKCTAWVRCLLDDRCGEVVFSLSTSLAFSLGERRLVEVAATAAGTAAGFFAAADFATLFLGAFVEEEEEEPPFFFGGDLDFLAGFFFLDGICATAAATSNESADSATVIARASMSSALASVLLFFGAPLSRLRFPRRRGGASVVSSFPPAGPSSSSPSFNRLAYASADTDVRGHLTALKPLKIGSSSESSSAPLSSEAGVPQLDFLEGGPFF
mmetsp:Transcript_17289/g.24469  ORF Transcript_17289/g.24469 Transcript_17289/m.24469 type:complete len:214 (-) Transcript_17289:571-1212(-)